MVKRLHEALQGITSEQKSEKNLFIYNMKGRILQLSPVQAVICKCPENSE